MKGLILAAGVGSRLKPLTLTRPKPMIQIGGKPIVQYIVESLRDAGINNLIMVVGYKSDQITEYFGNGHDFNVKIQYIEQTNPTKVEDAILIAKDHLEKESEFILCHADFLADSKIIQRTIDNHKSLKADGTIAVKLVENPSFYGIVEIDGEARVKRLIEKPTPGRTKSQYAAAGVYLLKPDIFGYLEKSHELDTTIQSIVNKGGRVYASVWEKQWVEVTYPWDILHSNNFVLQNLLSGKGSYISESAKISPLARIESPVYIGKNVEIRPGATIVGPCFIGDGSYIGSNALVRDFTSIGKNVMVGFGVELKNSVIFDHTRIGRLSFIGDSIIGQDVEFGAGTQTWNITHRNTPIEMLIEGEKVNIPLKKFGAVLGDNIMLGINISIHPGKKIGNDSFISAGVIVNQDIPSQSNVTSDQKLNIKK